MADSSANSIARKCRKPENTMVMVKSDQAGTPDKSDSHSPNFMRTVVILAVSLFRGLNEGNETKTDLQKKLLPRYHQLPNLGMGAIIAMALLF